MVTPTLVVWGLLVASAAPPDEGPDGSARDVAAEDASDVAAEDAGAEVIIVYDELRAQRARDKVIETAEQLGYTRVIEKDGRTVLRHELPWHGELVLNDDGRVEVKRQPVRFEPPFRKVTPATWLTCLIPVLCIKAGGQVVSPRRYHQFERELWAAVSDDVVTWNDRLADVGTSRKIEGLPERLELLWREGVPLEGEGALATPAERRMAVLEFWDTRTESAWGESVREAVEAFINGVIETSDTPFTAEERRAFEARRRSTRSFPFRSAAPGAP